jgi:hypothetical protein
MTRMQVLRESWRGWMSQSHPSGGPAWLQYVWTLLFSMAVAAGFTVVGLTLLGTRRVTPDLSEWGQAYRAYFVVSIAIGFCIHGLFNGVRHIVGVTRIRQFGRWPRTLLYAGVPFTGMALGGWLGMSLLDAAQWQGAPEYGSGDPAMGGPQTWLGGVALSVLLWFVFQLWFKSRHRTLDAERRITEAQLKLLQGQIEPHFLFNTLANVLGLMDTDTPRARLMLESFVEYLRASLGSLRQEQRTLGQELDLVEAYLRIVKIRMEDRLRYSVDVPEALRALPLPALTLQPLVENAITHGLEPQVDGGCVRVAARLDGGQLTLTVSDDGMGVAEARRHGARRSGMAAGSGTALANIRERLQQHHSGAASLQLEALLPRGTCATLRLPLVR